MNLRLPSISPSGEWRITGRSVFLMLVAFFGCITIVNIAMIDAAISTFGGVDTPSSYQAGLDFKSEEAAAAAQRTLGWTVDGQLTSADGAHTLAVNIVDKTGEPVSGLDVVAHLAHPADARRDIEFALSPVGRGHYLGTTEASVGQWRLDIDVSRDGEHLFRSRNHVSVH
jgi:nitrogen fixation protein FixH